MASAYDYRKYAILYVDDESQSLKYFDRAFGKEFRIFTATSVDDALQILEREKDGIGIVITDQRMPGRTGVDLLGNVRQTSPNTIRMLTTAYSDIESAIDAVNSGAIYRYVVKPWDIRDLRGVLMRGMEFFLVQRERDMLLREKLTVIQRLIVTDRVRSLAVLAAGLSHHIRNSMTALKTFLDTGPANLQESSDLAAKNPQVWENLWSMAQLETQHVIHMVQKVSDTVFQPTYSFADEVQLNELLRKAVASTGPAGARITVEVADDLPRVKLDEKMIERLFAILIEKTLKMNKPGGSVVVRATGNAPISGTAGVRVVFSGEGPAWTDQDVASLFTAFAPLKADPQELGLDMLSAFFIAFHHGGDLVVHRAAPVGPGFEITLPFSPDAVQRPEIQEDLMERLFLHFDVWDSLKK